jgi:inositol-phosphate phosphatase/L-galactose 1-phosphate phosphatase/histidinol-phosphatase
LQAKFLTLAQALADIAADAIMPHYNTAMAVERKADSSPVTEADKAAEAAMRELIAKTFPDHGIYGEEFGLTLVQNTHSACTPSADEKQHTASGASQHKGYIWVLDPIDGTKAFIEGRKEWGTLIALCEDGVPILGILNQPATNERWIGMRGTPTSYQRHACQTRHNIALEDAEISTTSAMHFTPPQAKEFVCLAQRCRHVVRDGDCYAYGLLACGERDIVVDAGLKPYDILALVSIIEGAGGTITHWDGAPISLSHYANVIAAGDKDLHHQAISLLQGA